MTAYTLEMSEIRTTGKRRLVLLCEVLNLSRQVSFSGERYEITVPTHDQLEARAGRTHAPLVVGRSYRITIKPTGSANWVSDEVMLKSVTHQAGVGQTSNMILILDKGEPGDYGKLARDPMATPPKFASEAEADEWMEAHAQDAKGALDRVLRPRGK